jgi:hypothetical protein
VCGELLILVEREDCARAKFNPRFYKSHGVGRTDGEHLLRSVDGQMLRENPATSGAIKAK